MRLHAQSLIDRTHSAVELVSHMTAMQAQDLSMSLWAVGSRSNTPTIQSVIEQFNTGTILRTHVLRPTWHLVSSQDIRWMLELSAERIHRSAAAHYAALELDEKVLRRCRKVLTKHLETRDWASRDELVDVLENAGVKCDSLRASHVFMDAELHRIVCSGPLLKNRQSYALLDKRAPRSRALSREEALGALALRYYCSHGPASVKDFAWWSGCTLREAQQATRDCASKLEQIQLHERTLYFSSESSALMKTTLKPHKGVLLLAAFDEYVIAYAERDEILNAELKQRSISKNGVFRPIVLHNGVAVGTWQALKKGKRLEVQHHISGDTSTQLQKKLNSAISRYEDFVGV